MSGRQLALIGKDIRSVTQNRRILTVMLMVPIVMTVVVPSVFVLGMWLDPESAADMKPLLAQLPPFLSGGGEGELETMLWLLTNRIMPPFFLMIPVMAASVMAASAFVGERERRTLETLLYAPLSLREIFRAKILAALSVGMAVTGVSFAAMAAVLLTESYLLTGSPVRLDPMWIAALCLAAPAVSLCAIGVTVRTSAKAQSVEEAQQRSAFLIFPILALFVGQISGVLLLNTYLMLLVGAALALAAGWILHSAAGRFTYEQLLGR